MCAGTSICVAPWSVAHNRIGMVAAVVLAAFVAIGLLDSLHFRPRIAVGAAGGKASYSVEVLSLFDWLASHLRTQARENLFGAAGDPFVRQGDCRNWRMADRRGYFPG